MTLETETKILDVTAEDIANGRPGDPWNCPFALAARRLFGLPGPVLPQGVVTRSGKEGAEIWWLEEAGTNAIAEYDQTGVMQPGQYTITRRRRPE
jgi:hypothetical protein